MKIKFLFLMVVFASTFFVHAQTEENKVAIGLHFGKTEYSGDLGNGILKFDQPFKFLGGISLSTYVSPSFDLGLQANLGTFGYGKETDFANFGGLKSDAFLFLHYKLNNGYLLSKESKLSPFLAVGLGLSDYYNDNTSYSIKTFPTDLVAPLGAGLKYMINEKVGLEYKFLYFFTNHDQHDYVHPYQSTNDRFAEHTLGLTMNICGERKAKDSDGDGVPDKIDKCPNTPAGVQVDAFGCPIDSDGDGVADYLDKCPNTPTGVKVDTNGCPIDTDKDGVPDYLDKCPNTPTGVKVDANGCPVDSDGDGVPDYLDKCPDTPAGVKVNASGCPVDSDGDGVPDYLDKCPDTPIGVKVDANGCPEATSPVFTININSVLFDTNKADIKTEYRTQLDALALTMKQFPNAKIQIDGHTDNTGDEKLNMGLSVRRADAVKAYLTRKGVSASRISTSGFGESKPVSDNDTEEGKAKNRRAEIKPAQ